MNTKRLRLVFYDFEVFYDDWCCTFIDYPSMKRKIIINDREKIIDFYNKWMSTTDGRAYDFLWKNIK